VKNKLYFLIIILGLIVSATIFSKTKGLLSSEQSKIEYIKDYNSSISDNNICIEIGSKIFLIPFILLMISIKFQKVYSLFYVFNTIAVFLQIIFLFILYLDGCSILKTILINKNVALFIFCFFLFLNIVLLVKLIIFRIFFSKNSRKFN